MEDKKAHAGTTHGIVHEGFSEVFRRFCDS